MRVWGISVVLGCLVATGCATAPSSGSSGVGRPAATTTGTATTTGATAAAGSTAASSAAPASTAPSKSSTPSPPTAAGDLNCREAGPGAGPTGFRLSEPAQVVAAVVCRDGGAAVATPAETDALATALALPQPPRRRVYCTDHVLADQPTWAVRLADGRVVTPVAPMDPCGRPIAAVLRAVNAILAGSGPTR